MKLHVAVNDPFGRDRHCIVRVQALIMRGANAEVIEPLVVGKCELHAPRRILAEHQVLAVEASEGLLVFAFDRSLHRRLQRLLDAINDFDER